MIKFDDVLNVFAGRLGYFDGETPETICEDWLQDYPDATLEFRYDFDTDILVPAAERTAIKLRNRGVSATEAKKLARDAREVFFDAMTDAIMNNR